MGRLTDRQCPNPAATSLWGAEGAPEICEYHDKLWDLNSDLGQLENSLEWLETYERQAAMMDLDPLEEALGSARERMESELARIKRETAELEEEWAGR